LRKEHTTTPRKATQHFRARCAAAGLRPFPQWLLSDQASPESRACVSPAAGAGRVQLAGEK